MPPEASPLTGLALSVAIVYWSTPLAIRLADRFGFYDKPTGYKGHAAPTPYLGGAAVVAGFLFAALLLTGDWERTLPLVGGVVVLWAVGTIDDRRTVTPGLRVLVEVSLASLLWAIGLSWDLGFGGVVDWTVSVLWVVAVINAFNLFDNMDGAASSMACVVSGALAVLGIVNGDTWLSVVAAALCGACAGFLPHNLASPARIFLGDGGSMPIGFAVAALAMVGVGDAAREWQSLAMGVLFVGVPALDTGLVIVSRRRRGLSILTGGRDHLTHRARQRLRTARAVALALGGVQAVISALALIAIRGGSMAILAAVLVYLVGVGVAIAAIDTRLAPMGPVVTTPGPGGPLEPSHRSGRLASLPRSLSLVLPLGLGMSPFFSGYYDSRIWVPAGLGLVVFVTAAVIARPLRLDRTAVLALVGLGGLGVWALASSLWADSIEQAIIDGNRWIVVTALLAAVLLLVRSDRSAAWLVGALTATAVVVAGDTFARMLGADGASLFVAGRLDGPLGYINGQASFYLLALWPCIALAEQRRWPILSGVGLGAASLLASLLVLSQSRGIAVAAAASTIFLLAVVPGRLRRAWALVVLAGFGVLALPTLLNVYDQGRASAVPGEVTAAAATAALLAALGSAVAWSLVSWGARRSQTSAARVRRIATGVLIVGALGGVGLAVASSDRLTRTIDQQYTAFVRLGIEPQGSGFASSDSTTRLASGAGTRYDYWRIAWGAFRERPVLGVGAGNYDGPYFERRATNEDVRQPHSVELQALSELGLVGALMLAIFLAALAVGAARLAREARSSAPAQFLAVAASGAVFAWLVHTSVDWIHLLPGVTGIAILFAAILLMRRQPPHGTAVALPGARRLQPRVASALIVAVALVVAGVSLSRQGLAEHFRLSAQGALAQRPADALRNADRALRLDPEAISSYYVKAAALARFNEPAAARSALLSATEREPHDFVTWALLGDLAVRTGDLGDARSAYNRATKLNPRDPALRAAVRDAPTEIGGADSGG